MNDIVKHKYFYDLHIHSCLSPCADNDMTPANIAGMAVLNGLNIVALTDHNTCKNCPAFFAACKRHGLIPIAGAELTTAEDIHLICLFYTLEDAMAFDAAIAPHRILIKNRVDIFGEQLIVDENDNILGSDEFLLSNAIDLSIDEAYDFAKSMRAVVYPAHIDRQSNGIVSTLGTFPDSPIFTSCEFHQADRIDIYTEKYPIVRDKTILINSDAHYLWDINEAVNSVMLDDSNYSSSVIRSRLLDYIKGTI